LTNYLANNLITEDFLKKHAIGTEIYLGLYIYIYIHTDDEEDLNA